MLLSFAARLQTLASVEKARAFQQWRRQTLLVRIAGNEEQKAGLALMKDCLTNSTRLQTRAALRAFAKHSRI